MNGLWKKQSLQIGNIIIPIACLAIAVVSSMSIGEAFAVNPCRELMRPSPASFAAWGIILLFLVMFMFYQARDLFRPLDEKVDMPYLYQVGEFFMLSTVTATAWYLLCLRGMTWPSVAAITVSAVLVLAAYLRLDINKVKRSLREHLFLTVGWSLYAGWAITMVIASIANGFSSLQQAGLMVIGPEAWTAIALLVAGLIYLLVLFIRNDYIFAGIGIWAIPVVVLKSLSPSSVEQAQSTIAATAVTIVLVLAMVARGLVAWRRRQPRIPRVKDLGRG